MSSADDRSMKAHFPTVDSFPALLVCGILVCTVSCRKETVVPDRKMQPVGVMAQELRENRLQSLPGVLYQNQASSPICWQPWEKATFERAKKAKRLIFCVVAMPQQPGFQEALAVLAGNSAAVDTIHSHYVPVLVDGDASREVGILTADLCSEISRPLNLPLFLWLTHEGNPVAWIPMGSNPAEAVDLFNQSHTMISQMWLDSPEYVLKNSALDNASRRQRMGERKTAKVMSEQPAVDVVRSIRQLGSLYDSFSRTLDETGGLFPCSAMEVLAVSARHPGLPRDARDRCMLSTRELLKDLVPSPMFDPLDGGVFSFRRGSSWAFPAFIRDCQSQARVAVAMIEAYHATGNAKALQKAIGLLAFSEANYQTADGMFAFGLAAPSKPEDWMWTVEEVEKLLGPDDAAWWVKATAMKNLGNLPSEVDPQRDYFRRNTLGLVIPMEDIAASLNQTPEAFAPRFEAVRKKLRDARALRLGKAPKDENAHILASLRMVSAYVAAFGATGDEAYRKKAVTLLELCRKHFYHGNRLHVLPGELPASLGTARAFIYALALQAVLDVAAITFDEQWLIWSEDLATTSAELFTGDQFLRECPEDAKLMDIPVTDLIMLFDDSTAGLVSSAETRLAELGRPLVASFSELAIPLPTYTMDRPVLHTDLLLATLARHQKITVVLAKDAPPELVLAAQRLQPRVIHRRIASAADEVPAASAKVILPGGEVIVNSPAALARAVRPPVDP